MVTLVVDDRQVEVAAGASVLDAVNRLGIALPQLCKDPDRAPLGACRTCLVEVEGQRGFPAACHLPARDGMVVRTSSPAVGRIRSGVLDLTLGMLTPSAERRGDAAEGRGDAPEGRADAPERNGFGQVGEACARHGLAGPSHTPLHQFAVDDS